ncbi:HipA domain-containing protein [Treponema sp.]|uniref:HipA domain-containing protein n=1 Tax=Treponema sp. TaxID=166 RepID=UPI00388D5BDC
MNEILASEICRRLGISFVPYELDIRDENYFCICPDISDEHKEMVAMASVYQDIAFNDGYKYDFKKLIERCENLKIPGAEEELLKIILLDFIIANEDRHSFNISFLRNSDNLQWIGVAPVYNSGKESSRQKIFSKKNIKMLMVSKNCQKNPVWKPCTTCF